MAVMDQVFEAGQLGVQAGFLEDNADSPADGGRIPGHGYAEDAGLSAARGHERGEDAEDRRFSAAVRPEQAENLPAGNLEADSGQGGALAVGVREVPDRYGDLGRHQSSLVRVLPVSPGARSFLGM